jgi:hypothetical protein
MSSIGMKKTEKFKSKQMQGQFYRDLEKLSVNKEKSLVWLYNSSLQGEMESLKTAAKDQALNTCYH